jgi:hypothetical protein
MANDVTLVYEGPQQRVVELDRDVAGGDELKVTPELADRLLCCHGFREKGKPAPSDSPGKLATRKTLESRAAELGLQVYESEEDERLAARIRDHGGDSTASPTKTKAKSGEKKLTSKQLAVAEADELGVSSEGTEAEIRDRIAETLAEAEQETVNP